MCWYLGVGLCEVIGQRRRVGPHDGIGVGTGRGVCGAMAARRWASQALPGTGWTGTLMLAFPASRTGTSNGCLSPSLWCFGVGTRYRSVSCVRWSAFRDVMTECLRAVVAVPLRPRGRALSGSPSCLGGAVSTSQVEKQLLYPRFLLVLLTSSSEK